MRFGEAIRLGIGAVEEDRTLFLADVWRGCPRGCAIGTALYTVGKSNGSFLLTAIQEWPWLGLEFQLLTEPNHPAVSVAIIISRLHNTGQKTRAELADFADLLDPTIPPVDLWAVSTVTPQREEVMTK